MIITCEECSTRFNLDDSVIKEAGSKVRCSVCRHIFTVLPSPDPLESDVLPAPDITETEDLSLGETTDPMDDFSLETTSNFEMESSDYSLDDTQSDDTAPDDSELDDSELDDSQFDFEDSSTPEEEDMDDSGDMEIELEEDFSFDEEPDDLSMEADEEELTMEEPAGLELDDTAADLDTDPDFAPDSDEEDATLDFDDAEPEEFDGIEFEPMEEDSPDLSDDSDDDSGLELDFETEEFDAPDAAGEQELTLEEDISAEDDFELEFDVSEEESSEEDFQITPGESALQKEEPDDAPMEEIAPDDSDLELALDDDAPEIEPVISPDDGFDQFDQVLAQETEPEFEEIEPEESEPAKVPPVPGSTPIEKPVTEMGDPPAKKRRRKKKPLIGTPVLVFILLFLLLAGAYIASLMTGYKIPYISDVQIPFLEEIFKKKAEPPADLKPIPNSKSVNGRFVTNSSTGTLFVITGTVDNPSAGSVSHIEVKGALIIDNKMEAKTKTAYCGNVIDENLLKTGNIADINNMLAVREGKNKINVNIQPGQNVPFMIVFSDLPEKLQNFTVKVTRFDKGQ